MALPPLPFAPSKTALRVRPRVHGGARTWSDAPCPCGGGVSRSFYALGSFRSSTTSPGARSAGAMQRVPYWLGGSGGGAGGVGTQIHW
jgi:hypothetical protein